MTLEDWRELEARLRLATTADDAREVMKAAFTLMSDEKDNMHRQATIMTIALKLVSESKEYPRLAELFQLAIDRATAVYDQAEAVVDAGCYRGKAQA